MGERLQQLKAWLQESAGLDGFEIRPASGDASFRRYFRVTTEGNRSWIAMDAPPDKEDCRPFVAIARQLAALGLHAPRIEAEDLQRGFLLLEDLGSSLYLDVLDEQTADRLYGDALGALVVLQACGPRSGLPPYDRALLMQEMELFREWLLGRHLQLELSGTEERMLDETFEFLAENALQQPQVCVLRDYHSRNLMLTTSPNPGILDFQDAVIGPVTYDLVSLLKDCYIAWPRARVEGWATGYYQLAVQSGVLRGEHEEQFLPWFDLMGVQRHLKAAGIFARLFHRDGKRGYLGDIPRTLGYIVDTTSRYPGLDALSDWLSRRVVSVLELQGKQ
jgi:aminoglycoside/choline kinase family phosphotransferase